MNIRLTRVKFCLFERCFILSLLFERFDSIVDLGTFSLHIRNRNSTKINLMQKIDLGLCEQI